MMTLRQLAAEPPALPTQTTWYLTDLAEARGKQELFTRQSSQKKPRPCTGLFHPLLHRLMTASNRVHDPDLSFIQQDARAS
ncbi:MAG TPA: hypothetical protein DCQ33_02160 [Nitrospira sp.]|jgi:hypothetical protein|nr:hypothetical protein NSND_50247 [Nitrospira sp. ND1]HAN90868.1 hypothetical protein [Nitrospira sp.]